MTYDFLDGNVIAGPLSDVFEHDITTMRAECSNCRQVAALGQATVYGAPMGYVVRCDNCGDILAVLVERTGRRLLALSGLRWIDITD